MMEVFVGDLDEAGAGFMEQGAGEKKAVAEIGEVGVDAEFPSISKRADHFGFLREIFVFAIFNVPAIDEGLEIGAVANTVWRIEVDHLYLASQSFFFEQGIHDQQRITGDEAVGPAMGVAVKIDGFAQRWIFFAGFEEVALNGFERDAVSFTDGFDNSARVDAFVDMERDGGNFEGGVFFFSGPDQQRVEVRIVFVSFARSEWRIGFRRNESDRRVVDASFAFVVVLLDGSFVGNLFRFSGGLLLAGHVAYLDLEGKSGEIVLWDNGESQRDE